MDSMSTAAVTYPGSLEVAANANPDLLDTALYYSLFREAEGVRWKMSDIPFDSIETDKTPPSLVAVMKELAAAELTTWTATNQFYEETKHPQALMRWLKAFGETFDTKFFVEGRKTYPFMNSKMGTLTINILSEIETATFYWTVSQNVKEPVLKLIAQNLAADEARHASSFYLYAKKRLHESKNPQFERFEALKVLYFWLISNQNVKHPFALFANKVAAIYDDLEPIMSFKTETMYTRMRTMVGNLIALDLDNK